MDLRNTILADAMRLPLVPLAAVAEYQQAGPEMIAHVNRELAANKNLGELIGNTSLQVMYDNHEHHWAFMATVFGISGFELLARTVPWVYRTYHSHGFSYDYFLRELEAWEAAVKTNMAGDTKTQILEIYEWLLGKHSQMIELAEDVQEDEIMVGESWLDLKNEFREKLLIGDFSGCMSIAADYLTESLTLKDMYLQIIQPAMHEIGQMWERAEISVAQEHLASAVVSRIMACVTTDLTKVNRQKGKAVITAAPGELHEIGAWMLSDILEQDGWQVFYLGSNTPAQDLLKLLDEVLPDMLAISVTLPFNVAEAKSVVVSIRKKPVHQSMKILVGGRVFIDNPELQKLIGADGFAANLDSALRVTREWSQQK